MAIKPLGSRLLVEKIESKLATTESGIIIGEERAPQSFPCKVVAVGPDCTLVKVGDTVYAAQFSLTECRENSAQKTLILPEEDIMAIAD